MTDLQKWLLFLVLTVAGVAVSYLWLDRPIAFFVHEHVRQYSIFAKMTQFPELIAPFAGALLFVLGLLALAGTSHGQAADDGIFMRRRVSSRPEPLRPS